MVCIITCICLVYQIATYEETVKNLSDEVEKLSEKETEARVSTSLILKSVHLLANHATLQSCMETVKSELDERKRQLKERNQVRSPSHGNVNLDLSSVGHTCNATCLQELHECEEVRRRTQEQKESLKLQLKELDHRIARIVKDSKEASRQVRMSPSSRVVA